MNTRKTFRVVLRWICFGKNFVLILSNPYLKQ
jgi:hypothetical protein